jgi:hypothetical protein
VGLSGLGGTVSLDDPAAYPLGHLGNYGVAESSKSVHPAGNPMSHSTHVGFRLPPTCTTSGSAPCELGERCAPKNVRLSLTIGVGHICTATARLVTVERGPPGMFAFISAYCSGVLAVSWATGDGHMAFAIGDSSSQSSNSRGRIPARSSTACSSATAEKCCWVNAFRLLRCPVTFGVGHDEDSVSKVRGTNGRRWYAFPFEVVPDGGQIGGNLSESESKQPWDVFQQHPSGSNQAKASRDVRPEMPWVVGASSRAGVAEWLARESTANKVGAFNGAPVDGGDVAQVGHAGPVFRQHPAGVGVGLGLPDGAHPGSLEAQLEAADAGAEATDGEGHSRNSICSLGFSGWASR